MKDFTHYSLFENHESLVDFAPLPSGGLRELLADLHGRCNKHSENHCVACGDDDNGHCGTLYPNGDQVSFTVGRRFMVILYSRDAPEAHAAELTAEGNESAYAAALACEPTEST